MGDMYALLHGLHVLAPSLLEALRIPVTAFPRFRDCYPGRNRETRELEIHVFTRMGGNNRECWGESVDGSSPRPRCSCHGCTMREVVPKLPGYLYDFDDEYDSTYATIAFKVPDYITESLADMLTHWPSLIPASFKARSEAKLRELEGGGTEAQRILTDFMAGKGPQLVKLK